MRKVIFLDRDGTLTFDSGYTYKLSDYRLLAGVKIGLKKLITAGFELAVLSNQSGIARGMFTVNDYQKFINCLSKELAEDGVKIMGFWYCPHHSKYGQGKYKIDCECRKPKTGLVKQAEKELGPFDYEYCWAVGDMVRDLEAAKNYKTQVRTILVPKNYDTEAEQAIVESDYPDFKAKNFLEAVEIILSNTH